MSLCYFYYDAKGNHCTVQSDCVSQHSDGCYYDHDGHQCHPQLDGIVEGTSGNDLINAAYTGDPEGDKIDNYDAIAWGAQPNDDYVIAGAGNDTVIAGAQNDKVYGGTGNDSLLGNDGNDTLYGEAGNDTLVGGSGTNYLYGGDGNDTFVGGSGADRFDGGRDQDNLDYSASNGAVSINLTTGAMSGGDAANDCIISGIDGVIGSAYGDSLVGFDHSGLTAPDVFTNQFWGNAGNDTIEAKNGNDQIYGGADNDKLYGGDGNDLIEGGNLLAQSPDRGYPGLYPSDPNPTNDLDLVYGGGGNDTISTGDDADTVYGGDGNDSIDGGVDDDKLYGENGNDTIIGGEGNDLIEGGGNDDLIYGGYSPIVPDSVNIEDTAGDLRPDNGLDSIYGGEGNDTVFGMDDADLIYGGNGADSLDGGIDNDTVYGDNENDSITGGQGDDKVYGGEGNDTVRGNDGNDTVEGGGGQDSVVGGAGNDIVDGGEGDDTVEGGEDNDTIYGGGGQDSVSGGAGNDVADGGTGDDKLYGGQGADSLTGGTGQDRLEGGDGNDTLDGGEGVDSIYGGADRDSIVGGNQDYVDGGTTGDDFDTLDLSGMVPTDGYVEFQNLTTDADGDSQSGIAIIRNSSGGEVGRVTFTEIEQIIPCFTPGTLIATPKGEVPVESLREGDRVITRDNGIQEIRWVGKRDLGWAELNANPHLKPVLVRQGSLGNGLPERDMMLSPNHRLLVANDRTALYFDEHEVLVAAKHLVSGNGIHSIDSIGTTYIHFMFDQHEIVLSDGAWTESFQPGDYTLKGMGNAQRSEILELFPELKTEAGMEAYGAARRTLKRHEARLLAR